MSDRRTREEPDHGTAGRPGQAEPTSIADSKALPELNEPARSRRHPLDDLADPGDLDDR
ncbi:MAG TPA: hypothetical protein VFJ19_05160 [Nocardioidaceae bacterium]|nr:hypothetical protein [Nocardioidaceae bacterium]